MNNATRIRQAVETRERARVQLQAMFDAAEGRELTPEERRTEGDLRAQIKAAEADEARAITDLENDAHAGAFLERLGAYDNTGSGGPGDEVRTTGPATHGEWLAAELRSITGASGVGAAWTPTQNSNRVIDFLAASSVFLASGVQQVRTDRDSIAFPHLTSDAASAWVAAGATITATDPGGDTITVTPEKLAALVAIHNEVIADSTPEVLDTVSRSLIRSLGLRFDLGAFEGSGTTPEIEGLANVAGIQTVSMGTNGSSLTNLDPFADALGALETENANTDAAVFVMHPRTWKAAAKLKEATGSNKALLQESAGSGSQGIVRSIYGRPVFLTSQLSTTETQGTSSDASSVYCYDVEQVFAVIRQDVRVELDRSRLFHQDTSEVRAIMRGAIAVPNPKAVCRITGVLA